MQVSRRQGSKSKTLPQAVIENKLERLIRVNGEEGINTFRDRARELAERLDMQEEFDKLNRIVIALLSTKPSSVLTSPLAAARAFGAPYDPARIELFNTLYIALMQNEFEPLPEKNFTDVAYRNFAFFESYFSNYIEGTRFEVADAERIIDTDTPMPARSEDSHDMLGTFYIVSNRTEMSITSGSADELLKLLSHRHWVLLSARLSKMSGEFKDRNNYADNTTFVDFNLVRGTFTKDLDYYNTLRSPFAKAVF